MDIKDFIRMIDGTTEDEKETLRKALSPILDNHIQNTFLDAVQAVHRLGTNQPCNTISSWLALKLVRYQVKAEQSQKYE